MKYFKKDTYCNYPNRGKSPDAVLEIRDGRAGRVNLRNVSLAGEDLMNVDLSSPTFPDSISPEPI